MEQYRCNDEHKKINKRNSNLTTIKGTIKNEEAEPRNKAFEIKK